MILSSFRTLRGAIGLGERPRPLSPAPVELHLSRRPKCPSNFSHLLRRNSNSSIRVRYLPTHFEGSTTFDRQRQGARPPSRRFICNAASASSTQASGRTSSPDVHWDPIILMDDPIIVTAPKARRPRPITNLQTDREGASVIAHIGPFFASFGRHVRRAHLADRRRNHHKETECEFRIFCWEPRCQHCSS